MELSEQERERIRAEVDALFENWHVWQHNEAMVNILLRSRTRFEIDEAQDSEWTSKPQPPP